MFELLVILLLVLLNGVFAGAEIAVIGLRRSRLQQLLDERSKSARAIAALRDDPERFLATVQIGITVLGATAAAFGGASLAEPIAAFLAEVGVAKRHASDLALAIVIVLVSYSAIVVGELVPKSIALRHSETIARLVARPLLALAWLSRPAIWLLTKSSNLLLRPFGDRTTFTEARMSAEELDILLDEAGETGSVDPRATEIASRALEVSSLRVQDVMVPRSSIHALAEDTAPEEFRQLFLAYGHKRLPVYRETLDDIVGYVTMKDVLSAVWQRGAVNPAAILRSPRFVPEVAPALDVLEDLQRRRMPMAIVTDEHGSVAGLVTVEDLVEELVGDLFSEHTCPEQLIRHEQDGSHTVRGHVPIREVNRALELELPEEEGVGTMAGLCMSLSGGIPHQGARLRAPDGSILEVLEATARSVLTVRLFPPPQDEPQAALAP